MYQDFKCCSFASKYILSKSASPFIPEFHSNSWEVSENIHTKVQLSIFLVPSLSFSLHIYLTLFINIFIFKHPIFYTHVVSVQIKQGY